jgi:uncharacterized protein YjdB
MLFMIFNTKNVFAAKVYSLVVSGYSTGENDSELMYNRISNSELPGYSKSHIMTFHYDQEKEGQGIDENIMSAKINESMQGATSADTFIFYYSGHAAGSEGITLSGFRGNGKGYYQNKYTWKQLATQLAGFPGKVAVILDVCYAEKFYTVGVKSLTPSLQKKFSCLLSCGAEEKSVIIPTITFSSPTGKVEGKLYGQFTRALGTGLGFWNNDIKAAVNSKGVVTLYNLYDYAKYHTIGFKIMTVKKYGPDISLFCYPVKFNSNDKNVTLYPSQTKTLTPYVTGKKVSGKWKSSDGSIVSVSSSGKLTAKKAGTATVTVTVKNTSATCKVTVKNPSLTINPTKATIYVGESLQIAATVKGKSSSVKWKTSKSSVATVDKGKVVGKKVGETTITATSNGISKKCTVKVIAAPSIKLSKTSASLKKGKTLQLTATVVGKSKSVVWKSNKPSIASVSQTGNVTAKNPGTATITATANGVKATCKITVNNPAQNNISAEMLTCKDWWSKIQSFDVYKFNENGTWYRYNIDSNISIDEISTKLTDKNANYRIAQRGKYTISENRLIITFDNGMQRILYYTSTNEIESKVKNKTEWKYVKSVLDKYSYSGVILYELNYEYKELDNALWMIPCT